MTRDSTQHLKPALADAVLLQTRPHSVLCAYLNILLNNLFYFFVFKTISYILKVILTSVHTIIQLKFKY